MPESVLLIDMGNTRIKWVWAVDGRIDEETYGRGGLDAFRRFTQSHADTPPGKVLLSSVAAEARTKAVMDACNSHWAVTVSRWYPDDSKRESGMPMSKPKPWAWIVGWRSSVRRALMERQW